MRLEEKMIDRSKQTAVPTLSSMALRFKRSLRAGASVLALAVAGLGAAMVQPAFADPSITYTGATSFASPPPSSGTNWNTSSLIVGDRTTGTLDIRGGATVTVGSFFEVGYYNYSKDPARLTIDGNGSYLLASLLYVDRGGAGGTTVIVSNGARMALRGDPSYLSFIIGSTDSSAALTARVIVTGGGSTIEMLSADDAASGVYVGYSSPGELIISDGGQVSGRRLQLGGTANGTPSGTATISGLGSAWNGRSEVVVGMGGAGTLNIFDGGSINDVSLKVGGFNTGVVNVGGAAGENAKAAGQLNVGNIVLSGNSSLNVNITDTHTVHAVISGSGTINQIAGTTILTGDGSAFSGNTYVKGGVLQIGDGRTTGILGGTIIDDSKVIFKRSDNVLSAEEKGLGRQSFSARQHAHAA